MRLVSLALAVMTAAGAAAQPNPKYGTPDQDAKAALADARKLPADAAAHTRYLSMYHEPELNRADAAREAWYWVNAVSREPLKRPRRVSATLMAVDVRDYGWDPATWERLADAEPFFLVRAKLAAQTWKPCYMANGPDGSGWYEVCGDGSKVYNLPSPLVSFSAMRELANRTHTAVPIVRADWFVSQAAESRYYEFLGVKDQAGLEELAGFDRELAQKARAEVAAVVDESGVRINNAQFFRFGTASGAWHESRDVTAETDKRNAVRNLDDAYQFDALEVFFTLPNKLWGVALLNRKGELQRTVPDNIAGDGQSTNNDRRVRNAISCIRCHVEDGLRPIADVARSQFRGNVALGSPDYERHKRFNQLYLSHLDPLLKEDRARYAAACKELTGRTGPQMAALVKRRWAARENAMLSPADGARELGLTEARLLTGLKKYALSYGGVTDPVLAAWLKEPDPRPVKRLHFEEAIPLIVQQLGESKP